MTASTTAFVQTVLVLLIQSTVLLLLAFGALRLTRRHGPAIQTLLGRSALSGIALLLLLAPLSSHIPPVWHLEPTPRQAATLPKQEGEEAVSGNEAVSGDAEGSVPVDRLHREAVNSKDAAPSKEVTALPAAAPSSAPTPQASPAPYPSFRKDPAPEERGSKAVGLPTILLLVWLTICQWHLTRLRRTARAITTGPAVSLLAALTPTPPLLLAHPAVHSPFLAGLRRPAIFLPAAFEAEFDTDALRAIFTHELTHRDRRDNAWTLASRLLTAVLWFQPLLWLLCRRLEQISEDACDESVLASSCPPRAYADCLLSLASRPPLPARQRTLNASVAPYRSSLGRRISRILAAKGTPTMSTVSLRLRLTLAALTLAAAVGGAFLVSSAPAQTSLDKSKPFLLTAQERRYIVEQNQDLQNLKVIGLALAMYEQDNHSRLPNANKWMDQITPYLEQIARYRRDRSVFYDPFQPGQNRYGYAFNRNCSNKSLAAFTAPAETVTVFDSTLGTRDASDTGASLRTNPALDRSPHIRISPADSNYVFVDGHARLFVHNIHPSFSLAGGMPSVDGDDHSILGAWVSPSSGAAKTAFVFSFANSIEKVCPWPDNPQKLVHFYGRYNAHPADLKYIFTRVWVEGKPMYTIAPEKHLVEYALSEDGQTITLKDEFIVYHRSRTYTAHRPKGFLWY